MKKSQAETIGLMVIVILFLLIGLIALRFMLISNPKNDLDNILSAKANNMANSIKNANLCNGNFQKAIEACCNKENYCDLEACRLIADKINDFTNESDEKLYIEALDSNENKCFSVGNCMNGISSNPYVFNNGIIFSVKVCRK